MANLPPTKQPPWTRHVGIGVNYVAAVAGFGLIGWWIDGRYDSSPWGVLIGAGLGLTGATYNLVRESLAAFDELPDEKKKKQRRDGDEPPRSE